ncbi:MULTISPECIES: hypothetical protein [Streptomyces]|uniref:hypothetical protein n=1 Tax=Streptomyces TaxID=1883 RepID=UPI000490ECB6|nr:MULTISPECIES: hypothetical protein [unclassified Streptomyces]MYY15832.1 hypothetical protein [Streptomyces sp. SID4912]WSX40010.1 hypothetical protein OG291_14195 [Streptomyces halstedii]
MDQKSSPESVPSWIPASGHALRHTGVHFDAVRMVGVLGEQVAYEIMQFTDFQAGPIVRSWVGERNVYFLLPPRSAAVYPWPAGARLMGRDARCDAFVGVPALDGRTWPLDWRSKPTREVPYVDPGLLHELTLGVLESA